MNKELRRYKDIAADLKADDVQPINSMINAALRNLGGRPATYANNEAGLNAFIENSLSYFDYVAKANDKIDDPRRQLILDVDSYAVYVGVSKKTILEYQKRSESWNKVISLFKDAIGSSKKQLALHGFVPSVLAVFDLCNNHGYVNTSEFKLTTADNTHNNDIEDDISLEQRCAELGLVWDEERQEWRNE